MCTQEDSNQPAHQPNQISFHCLHDETLHPWLFKMHPLKIMIRPCKSTGWPESSLPAHVRRYWLCGPFTYIQQGISKCETVLRKVPYKTGHIGIIKIKWGHAMWKDIFEHTWNEDSDHPAHLHSLIRVHTVQWYSLLYPMTVKVLHKRSVQKSSLYLHEKKCCGYSLEAPQQCPSNNTYNMFSWRNKKTESTHDKTYNKTCVTSRLGSACTSTQYGKDLICLSLDSPKAVKGTCDQRRLDVQADLSLH